MDFVDETYLCPVFEDEVVPLLRTDAPIVDVVHHSTHQAMSSGVADGPKVPVWRHPAGSTLSAWGREVQAARVVYIQPGDTAQTLAGPGYRRLVANALGWVARS